LSNFNLGIILLFLTGCAPAGFVETTANVIDEMTAFRYARKLNTREAWEDFIRRYPESRKAKQAQQWVRMMPDQTSSSTYLQEEIRKAEQERIEKERAAQELKNKEEETKLLEEQTKAERDVNQMEIETMQQSAELKNSILLAELKKREEELNRREEELKKKEAELAQGIVSDHLKLSEDIDVVPRGGLPQHEENFAIVIGIEKYRDIQTPADHAEKDARTMLLYLRDFLGFPEQNIKFLGNDRATRSDFSKEIELWLPLVATNESKIFLYFSGHGSPDPKSEEAYLLPYDGDPRALEITAYPLKRLYEKMNELPAKEIVIALDSCFSGAGGRSVLAQGARPLITKIETGGVSPAGNLVVFTAASGSEITGSHEDQKHGLFTYFFLKGLRGDADTDHDDWVSIQEEYAYLKKNVAVSARRNLRDQNPQLFPDIASLGEKAMQIKLSKPQK